MAAQRTKRKATVDGEPTSTQQSGSGGKDAKKGTHGQEEGGRRRHMRKHGQARMTAMTARTLGHSKQIGGLTGDVTKTFLT